jgi:uncharacterized membrane protein YbaN (DUF454 family)
MAEPSGQRPGRLPPPQREGNTRRLIFLTLGWVFVLLGIAGLFLPVLQGFLFLGIGLFLLSRRQAWAGRLLERLRRHYPQTAESLERAEQRARDWTHRWSGGKR